MNTTFLLSGGIGRVICAIPALEEYRNNNPDDDFKVLIHGWVNVYDSHPLLQSRTYDINQKGMFNLVVKNSNLVCPEPYYDHLYYNQEAHLIEAFQREINRDGYTPNLIPSLHLHSNEHNTSKLLIKQAKDRFKKKNFVVIQPFGSTMNDNFEDSSGRSMTKVGFMKLVELIHKELDAVILFMGDLKFDPFKDENILLTTKDIPTADIRFFMAMIKNSDCFVGIDSAGQHIARSFSTPGVVMMGSTFETNVTYPDWFKVYRKKWREPAYSPIRIAQYDSELADKANSGIMDFNELELKDILRLIKSTVDDVNLMKEQK